MIGLPEIRIALPHWLDAFLAGQPGQLGDDESAMDLAIALSRENVRQGSGGPFGALVIESASGRLVAVGVNLVLHSCASIAHAEMVALASAQQGLGNHDLSQSGAFTLVSSSEPCAMCMGAVHWSGVRRLVCGARDEDVRAAGFDEGHKPEGWPEGFARRGIAVTQDCLRARASAVLLDFAASGGPVY